MRRCVQGKIRHNSLRSAYASLGTYCVFPLHCAVHLKAVDIGFARGEAGQQPDIGTIQRTPKHPTPSHLRIRLIDAEASTRETL